MTANKVVVDAPSNTIRGPWEDNGRSTLPATVPQTDPRLELSDQALVVASTNAFPIVARQKSRRDSMGLAAGGAIALVLGCATFMSLSSGRHAPAASASTSAAVPSQVRPGLPMAMPVSGNPTAAPPMAAPGAPIPAAVPGMANAPANVVVPGTSSSSSPVLVYDGSSAPVQAGAGAGVRSPEGAPAMLAGGVPARATTGEGSAVHATRLAEPASTVVQGTLIPAVLETAIDTDIPGNVRAVVSQDVRSFDGSRVLIPRSSRLIGEYKAATQAGQRRAFLMWTRLIRPDGVSIALASPAADFTGQAGVGGQVNSHFFSRFGSAILMSILGGASSLATAGASTVIVSGAGQSAASAAIQSSGNRSPTIKVRQGEPIRVFTARDLVFNDDGANG
jgi:type IV secretion system protein VirB10